MVRSERWKFWGWGYEGDGLSAGRGAAAARRSIAERIGVARWSAGRRPRVEEVALRAAAPATRLPASPRSARASLTSACCTATASRSRTPCGSSRATSTTRRMSLRNRDPRTRSSALLRVGGRGRRRGDPVRRRLERRRRRRAGRRRRLRRHDQPRSARASTGCSRSTAPAGRRASRAACSAPRSRPRSSRTA